jgi:NADPH2:quinone reductase
MKAVLCRQYGEPLTVEDVTPPPLGAGEVRIRVAACGINFPDTLIIQGKYQFKPDLPFSPGSEVAGEVIEVAPDVSGFAIGDPVIAVTLWGGFAEEIVAKAWQVMHRPASIDAVTAAAFSMTYGTSYHALKQRAGLKSGETLLVLGAAGGVGLAAVELGRLMGARVIAAASSEEKLALAREYGASETIDYSKGSLKEQIKALTDGRGADVIYDPVGGDLGTEAVRGLAWNGRLLIVGFAGGAIQSIPANLPLLKGASVVGVFWGAFREKEPDVEAGNFRQLFAWHSEGRLKPLISWTFPLEQAADALAVLSSRSAMGKLVLTV